MRRLKRAKAASLTKGPGMYRRTGQREEFVPVAAEVLEVRALLSAGSAIAHHVQQALEHQHGVLGKAVQPAVANPIRVTVQITIDQIVQFTGTTTVSNVNLKVGSQVNAHLQILVMARAALLAHSVARSRNSRL
jgi:hypothetical protein